jgi:hypothetical protein
MRGLWGVGGLRLWAGRGRVVKMMGGGGLRECGAGGQKRCAGDRR